MIRTVLLTSCLMLGMLVGSCSAQTSTDRPKVASADAGFEVAFPCVPVVSKKLFQKEPKEANVYSYKCESDGINFSVSLPERFEDFDESKVEEQLDGIETVLKTSIGPNATITSRELRVRDHVSREFEVDSGNVYGLQLNVAHPRGVYGVQAFGKHDTAAERKKLVETARKFVDSFNLLEIR